MTDNLKLEMNEYLPLRDVVFRTLRAAIFRGELKPGERLMEIQLAQKLGVSRTPVREAIHMLEQEGLAVTRPRRGAEVARMTLKDMEDVLEIREALDDLAVQVACERITEEQLNQLSEAKAVFEQCTRENDVKKLAEADVAFHDVIYEATGNPKLIALLNNIREQLYRYRVEYLKDASIYSELIQEHAAIFESVQAHDAEGARQQMHIHVANQAVSVKEIIQKQDGKE